MSDFRMNKAKPIGRKDISTIANYNQRKTPPIQPTPVVLPPKRAFEVTPDLSQAASVSEGSIGETLGSVITSIQESIDESANSSTGRDNEVRSDASDDDKVVELPDEDATIQKTEVRVQDDDTTETDAEDGDTETEVEKPEHKDEIETADLQVKEAAADGVVKEGIEVPADGKKRTVELTGTKTRSKKNATQPRKKSK